MRGRTGLGWAGPARRPGLSSLLDLSPRLVQHPGGPFLTPVLPPAPASPKRPQLFCELSCHLCAGQAPRRVGPALGRQTEAGGGSHMLRAGSPPTATLQGRPGDCRTFGRFEFPSFRVTHRPQTLLCPTISWVGKVGSAGGSVPCEVDGGR